MNIKKSKKHRECPALGHSIDSADCGSNRGSHYACPASCPFNPWSPENYGIALDIDTHVRAKISQRLALEHSMAGKRPSSCGSGKLEIQEFFLNEIFHKTDTQGRTFFQRWEESGFMGLNNDECFFLKAQSKLRPMVVEILEFTGNDEYVARDRIDLSSPPMVIHDRSLGALSVRFTRMLGLVFPMPHYMRMEGAAIPIPEVGTLEAEEIVSSFVSHLGGPTDTEAMRKWLNNNFPLMSKAISALNSAFHNIMIESIKCVGTKTTYSHCESIELTFLLDKHPDVMPQDLTDDDLKQGFSLSWSWFFPKDADDNIMKIHSVGRPVLGTVLLCGTKVQLSTMNEARHIKLRAAFEKLAGERVSFADEKKVDHGQHLLSENRDFYDESLVPPNLLCHAPRLEFTSSVLSPIEAKQTEQDGGWSLIENHYRKWMDREILALDGKTPRQAAADLVMRPKVIALVKSMIRQSDTRRKKAQGDEDLFWLARELGLNELWDYGTSHVPPANS
jgi:hypothetical protein